MFDIPVAFNLICTKIKEFLKPRLLYNFNESDYVFNVWIKQNNQWVLYTEICNNYRNKVFADAFQIDPRVLNKQNIHFDYRYDKDTSSHIVELRQEPDDHRNIQIMNPRLESTKVKL